METVPRPAGRLRGWEAEGEGLGGHLVTAIIATAEEGQDLNPNKLSPKHSLQLWLVLELYLGRRRGGKKGKELPQCPPLYAGTQGILGTIIHHYRPLPHTNNTCKDLHTKTPHYSEQ